MVTTRADGHGGRDPRHRDWGAVICRRPVAELAVRVRTPTVDGAVCKQGAAMGIAEREFDRVRDSGDCDRCRGVGGCPISELAVLVVPPALDTGIGEHGAGVEAARDYRSRRLEA